MKKLLIICLLTPLLAQADVKQEVAKILRKEVADTGKQFLNEAVKMTGHEMQTNEILLNTCIEGSTVLSTLPQEYLLELIGNRMGLRLNPAKYTVNMRRHFYRCLCQHPEALAAAIATETPFPIIGECGLALGKGFVIEVRQFVKDLVYSYYRSLAGVKAYWNRNEKQKPEIVEVIQEPVIEMD